MILVSFGSTWGAFGALPGGSWGRFDVLRRLPKGCFEAPGWVLGMLLGHFEPQRQSWGRLGVPTGLPNACFENLERSVLPLTT